MTILTKHSFHFFVLFKFNFQTSSLFSYIWQNVDIFSSENNNTFTESYVYI